MWFKLALSSGTVACLTSVNVINNSITIMIYDKLHLWKECLTDQEFTYRFKTLNGNTWEFPKESVSKMIELTLDILTDMSVDVKHTVTAANMNRQLKLEKLIGGMPYRFEFDLRIVDTARDMKVHVTEPLLFYVDLLKAREQLLMNVIQKKDVEIMQYKLQGATLAKKNCATDVFNEEEFRKGCNGNQNEAKDWVQSFIDASNVKYLAPHVQENGRMVISAGAASSVDVIPNQTSCSSNAEAEEMLPLVQAGVMGPVGESQEQEQHELELNTQVKNTEVSQFKRKTEQKPMKLRISKFKRAFE